MALRHSLSQKSKIFASSLKEGAEGAAAPRQPSNCPINTNLLLLHKETTGSGEEPVVFKA